MNRNGVFRRRATDAIGMTRKQILEQRALRLSEPLPDKASMQGVLEIVEFRVGAERYAIETAFVREVFQARALTSVPGTPAFVVGIINVRGRIISVVDIRGFFGLPARMDTDGLHVLILQSETMEFALLADEIAGVSRIAEVDLQTTLPTLNGARAEYLKGITADRLTVLDAGKMLTDPALVIDEEVST